MSNSDNGQQKELISQKLNNKEKFEEIMKRKFFYVPSSEIYGGTAGLFDLGPTGAALENRIVEKWRQHFVYEDTMLEVRSCALTSYKTLKASGHVDRFSDILVRDSITNEPFRCDHLIKNYFENLLNDKNIIDCEKKEFDEILQHLDNFKKHNMQEIIDKYGITFTAPQDFNLMFSTSIGPVGDHIGFLRPETAQGIFTNFKRLLGFNSNRIPFAVAQIGFGFRNEISPRSGLIRCREFLMAEIEHFVQPDHKNHPKFKNVENLEISLLTSENQINCQPITVKSLKDAVDNKIIANNMIAYYIGRIYLFLKSIGIDMAKVRFRQHMPNEMAHYACDCWDCEIHSYHGWVECIGIADRACFDLSQHANASGQNLSATFQLQTPKIVKTCEIILDKAKIGKMFTKNAQKIILKIESLSPQQLVEIFDFYQINKFFSIEIDNVDFTISQDLVKSINIFDKEVQVEENYPHVIEPSFGIGRIMYSLLSHACMFRENDPQRTWFDLPPSISPFKCTLFPLSNKSEFDPLISLISSQLSIKGIPYRVDDLGVSIGKRYSRADEIGTPYGLTVDFDSIRASSSTITIRDRNTTQQVRIPVEKTVKIISKLINMKIKFNDLVSEYGLFEGQTTI